jgi:hypothetical protein
MLWSINLDPLLSLQIKLEGEVAILRWVYDDELVLSIFMNIISAIESLTLIF